MAQRWARPFLHSKPWQRCRAGYIAHRIEIDGGVCEVCHEEPGYIVHHKVRLSRWPWPETQKNFDRHLRRQRRPCRYRTGSRT